MDFTAFTVNRLPVFIPVFAAAFGFWDMGGGKGFGFLEKKIILWINLFMVLTKLMASATMQDVFYAPVAQQAEHNHGKVGVSSSNLLGSSLK